MPAQSNTEILLGTVIGQLKGIETRLDRQDTSRGVLHEKVNGIVTRITYIETDVSTLKGKVEGIEQTTSKVQDLTAKAAGAGMLGRGLLTLGGWLLGAALALYQFWSWLKAWFIAPG